MGVKLVNDRIVHDLIRRGIIGFEGLNVGVPNSLFLAVPYTHLLTTLGQGVTQVLMWKKS